MTDDMVGGLMLLVAAVMMLLTNYRAFRDKQVKGVHPIALIYFMSLNVFYVWFFGVRSEWWSMVGEASLVLTYAIWIGQYFYYNRIYKPPSRT